MAEHLRLVGSIGGRLGPPQSGRIAAVEAALKGQRKPIPSRLTLAPDDETELIQLGLPYYDDGWTYRPIAEIKRVDFERCPICHSEADLTAEHVPPKRLGGSVLVTTCGTCNNRFGQYEDSLIKHSEKRYSAKVSSPAFPGTRSISDIAIHQGPGGAFYIAPWNGTWPEWIETLIDDGRFHMDIYEPCPCRAYGSLLKSAYLAACAAIPEIVSEPESWPVANRVRSQLLTWRDRREDHFSLQRSFNILRHRYDAPTAESPAVTLCSASNQATGETAMVFRLGWRLVIEWPIDAVTVNFRYQNDPRAEPTH